MAVDFRWRSDRRRGGEDAPSAVSLESTGGPPALAGPSGADQNELRASGVAAGKRLFCEERGKPVLRAVPPSQYCRALPAGGRAARDDRRTLAPRRPPPSVEHCLVAAARVHARLHVRTDPR